MKVTPNHLRFWDAQKLKAARAALLRIGERPTSLGIFRSSAFAV
jgi:hypothetical protein